MPRPWRVKALRRRRPGGAQLGRGGVDAAQPLGQGEGALGLGAVDQEAAGLPAHPPLGRRQAPLLEGGRQRVAVDAQPLGGLNRARRQASFHSQAEARRRNRW
jgi:hypothetical protein